MNYNKENADKIDEYLKNNPSARKLAPDDPCENDEAVTLRGKRVKLQAIKLPLDLVFHNVKNGRYRDEYLDKKKMIDQSLDPEEWELDPTNENEALQIREMLMDGDPNAYAKLLVAIRDNGQEEPGIMSHDGFVYNANRRLAVLYGLSQDNKKYGFIRVVRLPKEIDGTEVLPEDYYAIELGCQMSEDFKLDYTPINRILKIAEGREIGLTNAKIASLMNEDEDVVEHELEIYKLMKQALEANGTPNEFKLLSENNATYSHFDDMAKQFLGEGRAEKVFDDPLDLEDTKKLAFKLVMGQTKKQKFGHEDFRLFPKIIKEDRIKTGFLDLAKINEDTGEEFGIDAIYQGFKRAKDQVDALEKSYAPQKLLISILDQHQTLNETLDNNPLLKNSTCKKLIDDILDLTKNLEEYRDKNQSETESN